MFAYNSILCMVSSPSIRAVVADGSSYRLPVVETREKCVTNDAHTIQEQQGPSASGPGAGDIDTIRTEGPLVYTKVHKHRKLLRSSRRTAVVAGKVLLLFAGASVYFISSFALEQHEFSKQQGLMAEQAVLALRPTAIRDLAYLTRQCVLNGVRANVFRPQETARVAGAYCIHS